MSALVLTLTRKEITDKSQNAFAGWTIEIFGEKETIEMTNNRFEWKRTAPYKLVKDETGNTIVTGNGPFAWILTPDKEPKLKKENGESARTRAWCIVNQLKSKFDKNGFDSVQTGPITLGPKRNQTVLYVWTLTKSKKN